MKLFTIEEIEQISALAMLDLSKDEAERIGRDLSNILKAFNFLEKVRQSDSYVGATRQEFVARSSNENEAFARSDIPCENRSHLEDLHRVFPESRGGFLVVPPVIDRDS